MDLTRYVYIITASALDANGTRIDDTNAGSIGDNYGREYATREEADVVAAGLLASVASAGLDASTEYQVRKVAADPADY